METNRTRPDLAQLLTPRQREILEHVRLGLTNAEIAQRVNLSEAGVRYHISEIMNKLGVQNRREAATWPDRPPWWAAVGAPLGPFWRKASTALPLKLTTAATAASALSFATAIAGLTLLAVLIVRAGGGGGDSTTADADALAATAAVDQDTTESLVVVSSTQRPTGPTPPSTSAPSRSPEGQNGGGLQRTPAPTSEPFTSSEPPQETPTPCAAAECGDLGPPPPPIRGEPGGGAMALDCDSTTAGVQRSCAFPPGAVFPVQVHLTEPPDGGYFGSQTKIRWSAEQLDYLPAHTSSEILSPDCDSPARWAGPLEGRESLLFGCLPFPPPQQGSNALGAILQFQFYCEQGGETVLELVPLAGDTQLGTHYLDVNLAPIDPTLMGARITCGACPAAGCPPPPPVVTPPPEPTPPPAGSGRLAVDCNATLPGVQTACAYSSGAIFRVQVHVAYAPADGYFGIQAKLRWSDTQLEYLPTPDPADEMLWVDCRIATHLNNQPRDPSMALACAPFPMLDEGSNATGAVFEVELQCQQSGETQLDLVQREGDAQLGSHFLADTFAPIDPDLTGARITCG